MEQNGRIAKVVEVAQEIIHVGQVMAMVGAEHIACKRMQHFQSFFDIIVGVQIRQKMEGQGILALEILISHAQEEIQKGIKVHMWKEEMAVKDQIQHTTRFMEVAEQEATEMAERQATQGVDLVARQEQMEQVVAAVVRQQVDVLAAMADFLDL